MRRASSILQINMAAVMDQRHADLFVKCGDFIFKSSEKFLSKLQFCFSILNLRYNWHDQPHHHRGS